MTGAEAKEMVGSVRSQLRLMLFTRLMLGAVVGLVIALAVAGREEQMQSDLLSLGCAFAAFCYVVFVAFSMRQARATNQASIFIASGRLDLAEEQLKSAMSQFSLYRHGKLLACHNLAVIAHGRKQYRAAAILCEGIMSLRRSPPASIAKTCRILLADCHLLLGDVAAALGVIAPLKREHSLSLTEQLLLLPIELQCQVANHDFDAAAKDLAWKVKRAELLESPKAAATHALLSVACRNVGQTEVAAFLERRARLYDDIDPFENTKPPLQDSPGSATSADNN